MTNNVYVDLGYSNAQEMKIKADLAMTVYKIMKEKKLTQAKVSAMSGVAQGDISNLINGNFKGFSCERIFSIILCLGQDINIDVHPSIHHPSINMVDAGNNQLDCQGIGESNL